VRDFLALHRDEYPLLERRSVNPQKIRSIAVVDAQRRDRLGKAAEWLDLPVPIQVWDHHLNIESDIPATERQIAAVGATTTLIVEKLRQLGGEKLGKLPAVETTVMALGIHVDTGSLTFGHSTPRDAQALAWLMEQGASLGAIAEYVEQSLSPRLRELLIVALRQLETETIYGYTVSWVLLETEGYIPGLSGLASRLLDLTESDALILGSRYPLKQSGDERLTIIGRSRISGTDLSQLFQAFGGGGHVRAASAILHEGDLSQTFGELIEKLKLQIPRPPIARDLMSSPVRTIRPETTIHEAQRILLRYGHGGLSVVDSVDKLVGVIARRDIEIALHHGFSHAPVKGYMTTNLKTITPETLLPEIESLMVTYDIGRLPVLSGDRLVGIVTRTDVLRQLHQDKAIGDHGDPIEPKRPYCPLPESIEKMLSHSLVPEQRELLHHAAQLAEQRGWHLYLVGGALRDLFLQSGQTDTNRGSEAGRKNRGSSKKSSQLAPILLSDIDLVVDGFHQAADAGAGVELAKELQKLYPAARLDIHGQFQTAALLWHKDPALDSLWIDIATARTEFYPYPAANPEVEASSIRQDLYRRDFTINALALRLTGKNSRARGSGIILDFFGGLLDLQDRRIRVLHSNSFIEDPTRIYRAVRFAVRLGFHIDSETENYIRNALECGIYHHVQDSNSRAPALETRLKSELKYILEAPYWQPALKLLGDLDALKCLHPQLQLSRELWRRIRLCDRALKWFDPEKNFPHWQLRLEVLIADLAPEYRAKVANNLQLTQDSIQRLNNLHFTSETLLNKLPELNRPSEIVLQLRYYDLCTLMLIAITCPPVRRHIWRYITRWRNIKPILDGNDLKALGYKPGRQFKLMLDRLLAATIDQEIGDRTSAEAFLRQHFPK
jgi:tRNA nucleotidyltransferase (CCA-adding enzyme)